MTHPYCHLNDRGWGKRHVSFSSKRHHEGGSFYGSHRQKLFAGAYLQHLFVHHQGRCRNRQSACAGSISRVQPFIRRRIIICGAQSGIVPIFQRINSALKGERHYAGDYIRRFRHPRSQSLDQRAVTIPCWISEMLPFRQPVLLRPLFQESHRLYAPSVQDRRIKLYCCPIK